MLASPWLVSLAALVPIVSFLAWRRNGLRLPWSRLMQAAVFGAAFGIDEAVVVVYLRGAVGLLRAAASSEEVLAWLPDFFSQTAVARRSIDNPDPCGGITACRLIAA